MAETKKPGKGVVSEITVYDDSDIGQPSTATKDPNLLDRGPNEKRRQTYIDAGYTNKVGDAYFYTPEGEKTRVRYDGSLDLPEGTVGGYEGDITAVRLAEQNRAKANARATVRGGETAGTTVPQNTQGNTKTESGTSANSNDGTIKVGEQNANLNYYQYGDDSNPAQQGQKGGMNPKYTGEGVSNSYIEYNPDLTVADLDPNYLYGENARQQNRQEAGYIARRNDQIASALYNEGLTSREDVANFLSQQKEWMNSTEADRENTIESIYKRLGQMKPQEEKPDLSKADNLVTDTSNTLYGKTTADEGNPKSGIETKVDANSVLNTMGQRRSSELKNFVSTDIQSIASCVVNGTTYWDEQTWRDAQELYPDFIAAVNAEVKKQRGQQNVTAIASGGEMSTNTDGQSNINNSIAGFGASNATSTKSSVEIAKDVHDSLAKNQTANEASATMEGIEEDMAILKNRLKNLRQEANAAFKGDAPDYLVKAYINNKTQEIQNQMSILEDRYNAAYNRYKQEVANTQWEKEYQLKEKQLELEEKEYKLKERQVKNGVTEKKDTTSSNARYNQGDKWEVTKMSDEEVSSKVDTLVDMFEKGQLGNAQCGVGIQTYYLPMLGISLNGISTMEQKKSLINEREGYMPKKGDLIILKGSKSEYGHIGIVTGVSEDGRISYLDWNGTLGEDGNGDGTPQMRWLKSNSEKIIGYRNVNKKDPRVTDTEWTEQDYTNFTNFLDTNNKDISNTDRDSIAEMYGFKDDLVGMREFATDALNNKGETETSEEFVIPNIPEGSTVSTNAQGRVVITPPEGEPIVYGYGVTADDPRLLEAGFDPVLGYNPKLRDVYERVKASDKVGYATEQEKIYNRKEGQLGQEIANYEIAKSNGIDEFSDPRRKVSRDWGFAIDKKDVYDRLSQAMAKKTLSENEWKTFTQQLGFSENDPNAIAKASDELAKFEEWQRYQLEDPEVYKLLNALEYIIMQDATKPQRWSIISGNTDDKGTILYDNLWGEEADWATKYNYILASEIFDKLINTKGAGATLYPVSDADMAMIKAASTLINGNDTDYSFKNAINEKYKALRQYIGKPIDDKSLDNMWNQEGTLGGMFGSLFGAGDFTDYLTIDHARYSGLFGGWNYGYKNTDKSKKNTDKSKKNTDKSKKNEINEDINRYEQIKEEESNNGEDTQSFTEAAMASRKKK